jgi:serine/threonine protein kinase
MSRLKRYSLHPSFITNLTFPNRPQPVLFARKEFRLDRTTEAEFQAEKDALELLLELKHENIIELFATYAYGPHFNLLMPWVDLTLFNYLRSAKPPINLTEKVALFEEMACVASALDAIHNFEIDKDGIKLALMGCHHDLKPQNILVQGTKFLIADFGLARFKELDQQSETRWKLGTRTYGPPEAGSGTKVSRPHDIWSFGCILSEVATFAQLGPTGIEGFVSHRTTKVTPESSIEKDYFHNKTSVKPEVLEWLQHLHEPVTDTIMPSVTTLVRRLLDPNPRTRPGAKFAQEALAKIVKVYGIDKIHDMPEKRTRENDNLLSTNEDGKYLIPTGTEPTNASHLPNEKSIRYVEDSSWPLIHVAAMRGEQQTVHRILTLEHPHASIASNHEGDTALHTAAKYGQTGVVDTILKFNAGHSLHSNMALRKNASGRTPLHLAAENGNKDCAVKIKQSMPDIDHVRDLLEEKDDFGKTPLNLAQENGHDFMLGCLSSAAFCY